MNLVLTSVSFDVSLSGGESKGYLVFNEGELRLPASEETINHLMAWQQVQNNPSQDAEPEAEVSVPYQAEFSAMEEEEPDEIQNGILGSVNGTGDEVEDGVGQL